MDNDAMQSVAENLGYTNPIGEHPFYILVETSGSNDTHDGEVFINNYRPEFNFENFKRLTTLYYHKW